MVWVSFNGYKKSDQIKYKGPKSHQKRHYELIFNALEEKVTQNQKVKEILLETGDLKLLPDHHQKPGSPAAYKYFDIYMEIRDQLAR